MVLASEVPVSVEPHLLNTERLPSLPLNMVLLPVALQADRLLNTALHLEDLDLAVANPRLNTVLLLAVSEVLRLLPNMALLLPVLEALVASEVPGVLAVRVAWEVPPALAEPRLPSTELHLNRPANMELHPGPEVSEVVLLLNTAHHLHHPVNMEHHLVDSEVRILSFVLSLCALLSLYSNFHFV